MWLVAYWLISVGVAAWFGQMKGRVIEALALGVLMGPFGSILAALLPDAERREEAAARIDEAASAGLPAHEEAAAAEPEPAAGHLARALGTTRRPSWRKGRAGRKGFEIDWGWTLFYGSWALFVGVSWLWLLLFG